MKTKYRVIIMSVSFNITTTSNSNFLQVFIGITPIRNLENSPLRFTMSVRAVKSVKFGHFTSWFCRGRLEGPRAIVFNNYSPKWR